MGKVHIYFAFLRDHSLPDDEARRAFISYEQSHSIWLDYLFKVYENLDESGTLNKGSFFPCSKPTYCGLISVGNVCIGPQGETYRCEHDFGIASKVSGDVWHGRFYNEAEFMFYSTIDTDEKSKCAYCRYLPLCMGGCMHHRIIRYAGFDCEAFQKAQFRLKLLEGNVSPRI